jgi:RsiW-degrading membrane proteinase PrsW (M82 family)
MVTSIALLVAFLIPLTYLYFGIYKRDFFQTSNTRLMIACFLWGAFAYLVAAQINSTLLKNNLISTQNLVRYSAPVLEEILKGAILLYLIRRTDFTYFVDGAIYGFTTGIGFAVFENIEYVNAHPGTALTLALARVFSTNLIHATTCGAIGIALGYSRFERSGSMRRFGSLLASVAIAMGLHITFNNLVNRGAPLALAILVGFAGAGLVVFIMLRGMRELKNWVNEELKQDRGVTSNEASIVNQFEKVDAILAPFAARFGPKKAAIAREMLLMQAQMGIHKRTAEKHQDEKMRQAAIEQVNLLRAKMDAGRKELGWYCMLQLRGIFPEEGNPWWDSMAAMTQAPKEQAGTGVWSKLNKKTKESEPHTEGL